MQASKGLVLSLFLSIFVFGITNVSALTTPANTTIAPYFGVSVEKMAALSTAYFLPFVLVAPLSGYLADLLGRKRLILHGGALLALGLVSFGYSRHLTLGVIAQFLMGSGGIMIEVVTTATISDLYRENPARSLNLSQVFFAVGAFLSPALVTHLLEVRNVPWPAIYFVAAIGAVLLSFGLLSQTFPPTEEVTETNQSSPTQPDLPKTLLSGSLLALVLAMLAYGAAEMAVAYGAPPYLEKGLEASKRTAGLSLSFYWGMMTVGRLIGAGMPSKTSYPAVLAWSCLAGGTCLAIASAVRSASIAALFFPLMGLSIATVWPTMLADARRRIEKRPATAFGIIMGAGGLGAMLYPLVVGRLAASTGNWHLAMRSILIPMAVMLLVFSVFYALDRLRRRKPSVPSTTE